METFPSKALLLCNVKRYISIKPGACKEKTNIKPKKAKSKWELSCPWPGQPSRTGHYHSHPPNTHFSKGYLFSEEGPENDLCPPWTPLGSQHLSAIPLSLLILGTRLDNKEQQLGCRPSCPQCHPGAQTPTCSGEAEHRKGHTATATSPRAHLSTSLVRCLLHTSNRRTKAKICTLYGFFHYFPATWPRSPSCSLLLLQTKSFVFFLCYCQSMTFSLKPS